MASTFFGSSARVQSGQKETAPLRDQMSASHKQQRQQPVRTLQPAAQTHSPAQALSWRPPATRRFLWDRTPQGPAVILDLANTKVQLSLPPATWKLLQRLHQGAEGTAVLLSGRLCAAASDRGLQVELCTGQVTEADSGVNVTLGAFAESGAQAAQLVSAYDVACSKQQTAGLGQLIQITSRCSKSADGRLSLAGVAALPAAVVTYKPILAKTVAPLPLARELQDSLRGGSTKPFEAGFLSMDQGRSLVLLAAKDPTAYAVPLMGVWAAGVDSVRHPLVAAACIKFLCSKAVADKALELDKSFLVLLYPQGKASQPVCYECHISLADSTIPLKAVTFTITAAGDAVPAVCELAPARELQLPGCPVSVGRRFGAAGLGSAGASPASERHSWQPGSKISPGSAGSVLSSNNNYMNRSCLRTGETPTILPACGLPPAAPAADGTLVYQPPSWTGGYEKAQPFVQAGAGPGPTAGLAAAGQLRALSGTQQQPSTGSIAADVLKPAWPAVNVEEELGTESVQGASTPSGKPAQTSPEGNASLDASVPVLQNALAAQSAVAGMAALDNPECLGKPTRRLPVSTHPPLQPARPSSTELGKDWHGVRPCSADAAELGSASAPTMGPSKDGKADMPSMGLKDRRSSEDADGACPVECSSVPSFACWSTNMGAERSSSSGASHEAAERLPPIEADTPAAREVAGRDEAPPPAAGTDAQRASRGAGPFHTPDGHSGSLDSAAQTATQQIASQAQQSGHTICNNASYSGGPWGLQPPEGGPSREVAVLQQEVFMLRQQVQMLQYQLQMVHTLQSVPIMLPPPYGNASFGADRSWMALSAAPWLPPQPSLPVGQATPGPALSVQQSCSAVDREACSPLPAVQPFLEAGASQQGSPGAIIVVAAGPSGGHEGSPCSDNSLIPAFRKAVGSQVALGEGVTPGVAPVGQQPPVPVPAAKLPPQMHAAAQQAVPAPAADGVQLLVSATLARQEAEGILLGPGAWDQQAGSEWCQAARHGGDALPDSQAQSEPSRVVSAEAEIDRLIADAERAVSVLSCHSDHGCSGGSREAPGAAAMPARDSGLAARSTSAPSPPCSPGHSAANCSSPAAPAGPTRTKERTPLHFAAAASSLSSHGTGISVAGVVRVKVPSFWDCGGSDAESEDEVEVERLEQKYGLRERRK